MLEVSISPCKPKISQFGSYNFWFKDMFNKNHHTSLFLALLAVKELNIEWKFSQKYNWLGSTVEKGLLDIVEIETILKLHRKMNHSYFGFILNLLYNSARLL